MKTFSLSTPRLIDVIRRDLWCFFFDGERKKKNEHPSRCDLSTFGAAKQRSVLASETKEENRKSTTIGADAEQKQSQRRFSLSEMSLLILLRLSYLYRINLFAFSNDNDEKRGEGAKRPAEKRRKIK